MKMCCAIYLANTQALITQLICAFAVAYAKRRFSCDVAQYVEKGAVRIYSPR